MYMTPTVYNSNLSHAFHVGTHVHQTATHSPPATINNPH